MEFNLYCTFFVDQFRWYRKSESSGECPGGPIGYLMAAVVFRTISRGALYEALLCEISFSHVFGEQVQGSSSQRFGYCFLQSIYPKRSIADELFLLSFVHISREGVRV